MGHVNKKSVVRQVEDALAYRLAIGDSKHSDKQVGGDIAAGKIYSWSTFRAYLKHGIYFARWCRTEFGCKTLAECRPHAEAWLYHQLNRGLSPYTLKLERAALVKIYGDRELGKIELPVRAYDAVTRSREACVRDAHFSRENNIDLITLARCTGLRRSELAALRGSCLRQTGTGWAVDVHSGSKGGRPRLAPIMGSDAEIEAVCDVMRRAGADKVFPRVHSAADIHGYRREYAQRVYDAVARSYSACKASGDVYYRRGTHKGEWLDRRALVVVTRALGHNRTSVAAEHYLK